MKKFLTAVAMALLLVGCAKETVDLSSINEKLAELDNRVSALEGAIASIQSAIGGGVFVQKVEQYADPETGKTIGVTVTYTSGKVVYFEISPKADYSGPVLGVIRSGSGSLVWAVDGIAIKDADGEEVPVNKTPVFTIDEEGYLWVSIDGGDPVKLGPVKSEGASLVDGIFKDIKVEQDKVVLVLSDDSIVNIPFAEAFKLIIEQKEYVLESQSTITIPYTVSGKTANTVVGVAGYDPYYFYVEVTEENIMITPLQSDSETVFLIYADSQVGLTSMVSVSVSPESAYVLDPEPNDDDDYVVEGDGGTLEMHVVSNVEIEAKVPEEDSWISIVSTKSTKYTITAKIEENTGDAREGRVRIYKKGTDKRLQTIYIYQAEAGEEPTGPVNLSAKGVANSYIVTKAGEYTFAAVKGNSLESVGTVAKAEIVWETENTTTAPEVGSIIASVSYANDYITFSTPETLKPGNALIAAKDASDNILWSWHIWIPKTAIALQTNTALVSKDIMDRDLGSLEASPVASALRYQWGRKDPLVPADFGATAALVKVNRDPENIGIEYAIQHPTAYIKGSENTGSGNWCKDPAEHLWNDADGKKTIYDPCPVGYRVPVSNDTDKLWVAAADGWSAVTGGVAYGEIVFPYDGYLESSGSAGTSLYHGTDRTMLWSATYSNADKAIVAYLRGDKVYNNAYYQYVGGNVRCVVDDGTPAIPDPPVPVASATDLSKDGSANSYIVTKAGDFKFQAVQGNSSTSVGTVASVELVWETNNTATAPEVGSIIAKVGMDEGFITFSTPETLVPGNALIAAKDAEGKILWSWHIWIPKTAIALQTNTALVSKDIMDRDLGSLEASPVASALRYQWGRKDPLVPADFGATAALVKVNRDPENIGIEYAIQHPTAYIKGSENTGSGNWCKDPAEHLWNDADGKKTIYDPCPVGYRVPVSNDTDKLWVAAADGWSAVTGGVAYGEIVFPYDGYLESSGSAGTSLYHGTDRTMLWSATYSNADKAIVAYLRGDKVYNNAYYQYVGGNVRCIAE